MSNYWPWWAGAAGLALFTISHAVITGRSFGVSSAWDRVLHWRQERKVEQLNNIDENALSEALAAATAEHFRASPGAPVLPDRPNPGPSAARQDSAPPAGKTSSVSVSRPAPLVAEAAILVAIFVGGLIAAITTGRFKLQFDMGSGFSDVVTTNPVIMVCVLFAGGVLVGFGTRLAGGCSSGHGLSGCGRLRPVSLVATAVFFGTGVAVSFLLWKVI